MKKTVLSLGILIFLSVNVFAQQSCETVKDIDDNVYSVVLIGKQCWMKDNLRTTHYADGTTIPMGSEWSFTKPYRYYPDGYSANVSTYGYLYNWKAVMHNSSSSASNPSKVQGICPKGWHVPSDAEWTQLENYVGSQSMYQCGGDAEGIAKALASTTGWETSDANCDVGYNPSTNNATGFSAVPAGDYIGDDSYFGILANFWSGTQDSSGGAYYHSMSYGSADVGRNSGLKDNFFSVRCVRDN